MCHVQNAAALAAAAAAAAFVFRRCAFLVASFCVLALTLQFRPVAADSVLVTSCFRFFRCN